jgi:uncharacterized protein YegL
MESRIISPSQDWTLFFSAILNTDVTKLDIQVQVADGKIKIKTRDKALAEKIASVLDSPENIRGNLAYTIQSNEITSSSTDIQEINYPESIKIMQGDGKKLFSRLIGTGKLKVIGCPKWLGEVEPESPAPECKVLYAKVEKFETLAQVQLGEYRKLIINATYADFRRAFAESQKEYKFLPERASSGIVGEYIDKILYKKDGILYFDYGFLTKCLLAPVLETKKINKRQEIAFEINEEHLISYLGTIIDEDYILHITGNPEDATQQARPICFNMGEAHAVNIRFSFLLDCSDSMQDGFSAFKDHIRDFIKDIVKQPKFRNSIIRITPFATEVKPTKEFTVKELEDISQLEIYLSQQHADGATDLDNAVCTTLKFVENGSELIDDIIFIWTDGKDSYEGKHIVLLDAYVETLKQKSNPPKIYAIGFGSSCDEDKLTKLGRITGTNYINLRAGEKELKQIHQYLQLEQITKPRKLIHFIQSMHPVNKEFTVIAREHEIAVAKDTITIPGNVSVNGQTYSVGKGSPQLIAPLQVASGNNQLTRAEEKTMAQLMAKLGWQYSATQVSTTVTEEQKIGFTP